MKPRTSLTRNAAVMTSGTLISRVTGVGRTVAMGYAFGAGGFTATYMLANQAPTAIYELLIGGILAATLVPIFVSHFTNDELDEDAARKAVSAVLGIVGIAVVILSTIVFFAAPWIISASTFTNQQGTLEEQREAATFLLRLFIPQIGLYGFVSIATAVLNAKRRFGPPMYAPIFNNLTLICLFLAVPLFVNDLSLEAMSDNYFALSVLGVGTTAGIAAMALLLVPYVRKESKGRLRFTWEPRHPAVIQVIKLSGWTLGFVIANQIAFWLSVVLANGNPSDLAAYQYAYTFFILPHGIYAVSIMSALQPELAEHWAKKDIERFRAQAVRGLRLVAFGIVPATVGYALLVHPIVEAMLLRGAFSAQAADVTAQVLFWMIVGLPGFSAFLFLTRAFQAMQAARTVFLLYAVENGIHILAALALYPVMGVYGLGLAQSLGYGLGAVVALAVLRNKTQGLTGRNLFDGLARISVAAAVMGVVVYTTDEYFPGPPLVTLLAAILTGSISYAVVALTLRLPEVRSLLRIRSRAAT